MTAISWPEDARRPSGRAFVLAALALVLWPSSPIAQQHPPLTERVDVARVLIDARAFDDGGRPILGLGPADFLVRIDGRAAPVESAEWVGRSPSDETGVTGETSTRAEHRSTTDADGQAPGRLVVFLVQKDLEPMRITGLMQIAQLVDTLLAPLTPDDRVAVLSFDSRLRFWVDFTNNLGRVRSVLSSDVLMRHPGPVSESDGLSLLSGLTEKLADGVHGIEHSLRHIAEALEPLPGAKSLVLLGYGFGRWSPMSGVILMDGYAEASAALQRARVAVFTLNVTQANYNSLQAGLQTVAAQTGGVYASTFEFPTQAIRRVSHALAGYYVLFVEKPDLERGPHRIEVKLRGRRGTVMARRSYVEMR